MSMGRKDAPLFNTASMAITISGERSMLRVMILSGVAPFSINQFANRFAC